MTTAPSRRTWRLDRSAEAKGIRRPDGRWLIALPPDRVDAWPGLTAVVAADVSAELITHHDGDLPAAARAALGVAGFEAGRVEQQWRIPVSGLARVSVVQAHDLLPVNQLDLAEVVELDNAVRADIPGTEEWRGTVADLQESFTDDEFDPALYLVARHPAKGSLDGLIRVWNRPSTPRLGCLGVTRPWRRTRLAAALVGAVGRVLAARSVPQIVTETDESNWASATAARRAGGTITGTTVEWRCPANDGPRSRSEVPQ